jgi:alginate O-acetyltransferase complex protein AlgI
MQFDSPIFFLGFLPVAIALIFLSPRRYSNVAIIILSLVFYTWGEPKFALVVVASAAFDWTLARYMNRVPQSSSPRLRRLLLLATVVGNVSLLVYYKYLGFLVGNLDKALSLAGANTFAIPSIALPIGVSFVVFEKITYVVDIYRGVALPAESFLDYLAYILLFPKLLAGPIVKYHEIVDQLRVRPKNLDDVREGATRFCYGMGKKVLIADLSGDIANAVFALPIAQLSFGQAWLGALAFSVQIYFDFSAYSDMAIGIARVLGFRLRENFNYPYTAQNITEFWRRWHISLSSWIREYIYIPLGGSRVGTVRTYVNLTVAFLLSGFWHGLPGRLWFGVYSTVSFSLWTARFG